jgi:Tfp pilus assembly protein PilF
LYAEKNDIQNAIYNYSNAVKYNPSDYQAFYKRARMYMLKGDVRMAMDDFLSTTKLNPKIHDAWFNHGMNYYNLQ